MASLHTSDSPSDLSDSPETLNTALDEAIHGGELTELHAHLMGMGSADFWVARIMQTYLPRLQKCVPRLQKCEGDDDSSDGSTDLSESTDDSSEGTDDSSVGTSDLSYGASSSNAGTDDLSCAGWEIARREDRTAAVESISSVVKGLLQTLGCISRDDNKASTWKTAMSTLDSAPWWILRHFTTDVVYSESRLLTASGILSCVVTDQFKADERRAAVRAMLDAFNADAAAQRVTNDPEVAREAAELGLGPITDTDDDWGVSFARAELESRMFDECGSAKDYIKPYVVFNAKDMAFVPLIGITNANLVRLLHAEACSDCAAANARDTACDGGHGEGGRYEMKGPLHGLVRNWFEFLDVAGGAPSLPDILSTCAYCE